MKRKRVPAYSRLQVKLPTFLIILVKEIVKDGNRKRGAGSRKWTVSKLLEMWLLDAMTDRELRQAARRSPEFAEAAEAYIRGVAKGVRRADS